MEDILSIGIFLVILAVVAVVAFIIQQAISFVLGFAWVLVAIFLLVVFWVPAPLEPWLGSIQVGIRAPFQLVIDQIRLVYETTFSFL